MCDLCRQYPCDYRCPNAPEQSDVFAYCDECGKKINLGDEYFAVGDYNFCEDCVQYKIAGDD